MIIELIMNVIYSVFRLLTTPINIPSLPDAAHTAMSDFFGYLETGVSILSFFCHMNYLFVIFGIVLAVELGIGIYKIVMWIIRKIPFAGMS